MLTLSSSMKLRIQQLKSAQKSRSVKTPRFLSVYIKHKAFDILPLVVNTMYKEHTSTDRHMFLYLNNQSEDSGNSCEFKTSDQPG